MSTNINWLPAESRVARGRRWAGGARHEVAGCHVLGCHGRAALWLLMSACLGGLACGQTISPEQLVYYTQEWKGERFEDGRPKVPDDILKRMVKVSIEEAWSVLGSAGYRNQFEGQWKMIHADRPIVGRA